MNNTDVEKLLQDCNDDLNQADLILKGLGQAANVVPYLNKYGLIRACGTIEVAFKTIICDVCINNSKEQIKYFINKSVKNNSVNPRYEKICKTLSLFDKKWNEDFKRAVKEHTDYDLIQISLESLVDARNEFAHGGNPTVTLKSTMEYFGYSKEIIVILDSIVKL